MLQRDIGTTVKIYWCLFFFFKSAIIADRPLWITEGFFNLLILLQRRTGSYLSMIGSENFSSWLCFSFWFLHICRSMDCFFPFSQVFRLLRRKYLFMRASSSRKRATSCQYSSDVVFLSHCVPASSPFPTALPRAGCTPPGTCLGRSSPGRNSVLPAEAAAALDPRQPCTALPGTAATAPWATAEAPTPSPQPE